MGIREEVVDALQHEGRPHVDHNGRTWEMTLESDECSSIMDGDDGDWFGQLEWVDDRNDYPRRPHGFNGRARKLGPNQGHEAVWWQPPADVADDQLNAMAATISDILSFGYVGVVVTCDHYTASILGIEPFPDAEMIRATVEDLVIDVLAEIETAAIARARETFTLADAIR